jgi:hypothetical protein
MGTYLCLKHVHLVCACAVLNGHIFVSQVRKACLSVDPKCTLKQSKATLCCTASRLHHVYDILQALEAIECRSTLRGAMHDCDNPDDMLSALEHFMGLEGKAASVKCSQCHSADLTCLSRLNAICLSSKKSSFSHSLRAIKACKTHRRPQQVSVSCALNVRSFPT